MPFDISAAPITSATASAICETAKMFLRLRLRLEPVLPRDPDFS